MDAPIELPPPPDPDPREDPIARAVIAEVVERGDAASVAGIIERSGVSADAFSQRYASLEACALDTYERNIAIFKRRVGSAFNAQPDWRSSLRAAAYETADWMEEDMQLITFGMTGVLGMKSELARVRREEVFGFCAQLIDRGRTEPGSKVGEDDEAAAMFAIGSIVQLLTHRLQGGGAVDPRGIVPEMMYTVVRAYLDEETAREELTLPRPAKPAP